MRVLLVVYDNGSKHHDFPAALAYIAGTLRKEKIDVEFYNQDVHHYPDEHLTGYLDKNRFDVVGISTIGGYYQYSKLLGLSNAINSSKNRPFYVIGGHGPSPEPEYFLKKTMADAVVIGEGEITIINLLNAITGHKSLSAVKGIAYREGDRVIINERQPLIKDVDSIPWPAYELLPMYYYRLLPLPHCGKTDFVGRVHSGRGCIYKCNFCYRMDKGYRPRKNSAVIEEIKWLKEKYSITYVGFSNELFMISAEQVETFCKDFMKEKVNLIWCCSGRLNIAKPDILKLMKQAGCVFINYGIESMDDQVLKNMNKHLTVKQIVSGIEATLKAGISPGYNIIFGNIGENKEALKKGVEFLLKYDNGAQFRTIRPVTPYPGTALYYYAIEKGLLKDCADFYEVKHINSDLLSVNFTDMSDDDFHCALYEANRKLIFNYFKHKEKEVIEEARDLYLRGNADFRGFRQI